MFRELTRIGRKLPMQTCVEVLKTEKRGVLSVLGDDGYPYGVPLNHWYCEEDGRIYFHSGPAGHKIDAMRACGKASFCVYDPGSRGADEWALTVRSVIVFGRIVFVEDHEKALEISRQLSYKFTQDEAYIQKEIDAAGARVLAFALEPEHICGKLVIES